MKKGVQNHSLKSSIITKALFGNVFYYSTLLCFCLLFLTGVRRTISSVKEYELEIETANMMRSMTEKYRKMCLSKSTLEEDAYRAETKQSLVIFGKKQSYKVSLLLYIFISINNLPWTSILYDRHTGMKENRPSSPSNLDTYSFHDLSNQGWI